MKRASIVREKKYYELVEELKSRTKDVTFSATKALSLLMLLSRYLVNYTTVESVDEIDEDCAEIYFNYLMDNHKRLGINLTDIKRSMYRWRHTRCRCQSLLKRFFTVECHTLDESGEINLMSSIDLFDRIRENA